MINMIEDIKELVKTSKNEIIDIPCEECGQVEGHVCRECLQEISAKQCRMGGLCNDCIWLLDK